MKDYMKIWSVIIVLILVGILMPIVPYPNDSELKFDDQLRIITYNTHFGINADSKYSIDGLIEVLKTNKPDIVFFQEIVLDSPVNGYTDLWRDLVRHTTQLGYDYHYISDGNFILNNAIISRLPLADTTTHVYGEQHIYSRSLVGAVIHTSSITLDLYTTHLAHSHQPEGIRVRLSQFQELISITTETTNPTIIGGDMNDYDNSTGYELIMDHFNDSWSISGSSSTGFTSSVDDLISRIDYLFISNTVTVTSCQVIRARASDHYPLMCEYNINIKE